MTRRSDLMLEDLYGCAHSAETPIVSEDGATILHWICRCGRKVKETQTAEENKK